MQMMKPYVRATTLKEISQHLVSTLSKIIGKQYPDFKKELNMRLKNFSEERAGRQRRRRIAYIVFSSLSALLTFVLFVLIVITKDIPLEHDVTWGILIVALVLACCIIFDVIEIRGLIRSREEDAKASEFEENREVSSSHPLRKADPDAKNKILLEAMTPDYNICYRRVGRVNELVINGYVYSEIKGIFEFEHTLRAVLDGHAIEAGLDDLNCSFITLDDRILNYKQRML